MPTPPRWQSTASSGHLEVRNYSPSTVRAYAFDLSNFVRFLEARSLGLDEVRPTDLFDYLDWQQTARRKTSAKVVPIGSTRVAPATMNRRIASVRGLFEHMVIEGTRKDNPVPAARRSSGLRSARRGLLGHISSGRPRTGGQLVRQPQRLPESLDTNDVAAFLADLETHRDRAIVLAMVFGGLRAAEVRSLHLADVDMGLSRVRVVGKGGRERSVPVDRAFFSECAAYVRNERPTGCPTPECFVVLRGPTSGAPLSEDGLRKVFRTHRARSGAIGSAPTGCATHMAPSWRRRGWISWCCENSWGMPPPRRRRATSISQRTPWRPSSPRHGRSSVGDPCRPQHAN